MLKQSSCLTACPFSLTLSPDTSSNYYSTYTFGPSFYTMSVTVPNNRIVELASIIQRNAIKVDEYITRSGLPSPSFNIQTPAQLDFPEQISAVRTAIIEAMDELQALLLGPLPMIFEEITQNVRT
jgi:hypothetical protein